MIRKAVKQYLNCFTAFIYFHEHTKFLRAASPDIMQVAAKLIKDRSSTGDKICV